MSTIRVREAGKQSPSEHVRFTSAAVMMGARRNATSQRARDILDEMGEVVYYLRRGPHIKVGWTTNMRKRLYQYRAPITDMIAVERGGFHLEQQRHAQFTACRVYGERLGREHYWPSRELIEHINAVRGDLGVPPIRLAIVIEKAA